MHQRLKMLLLKLW